MSLLVVTPTLGHSRWLDETVASVARNADGARHVLVVPGMEARALAGRFPNCEIVADPGGGMYAAINAGLEASGYWDAFTYINDDDVLLPGFSCARTRISRERGEAMVYGGVRLIDADGHRLGGIPVSPIPSWNRTLYGARIEPVHQHGTIITRAAWARTGVFDQGLRFCGDSDYLARVCLAEVPVFFVRSEVAAFRLRAGQMTGVRERMDVERALVDVKLCLPKIDGRLERMAVCAAFRLANAHLYVERVRRHGWKRLNEVIVEQGQR